MRCVRTVLQWLGRLSAATIEWLDVAVLAALVLLGTASLVIGVLGGVTAIQAILIVVLFAGLATIWLCTSTAFDKLRNR